MTQRKTFLNQVGSGLSESCYSKCMALKLRQDFDLVEFEKSLFQLYIWVMKSIVCRADIVVDGKFVVELKAVKNKLSENDKMQLKRYMRILKIDSGLLVNFGKELEYHVV